MPLSLIENLMMYHQAPRDSSNPKVMQTAPVKPKEMQTKQIKMNVRKSLWGREDAHRWESNQAVLYAYGIFKEQISLIKRFN